jgi:hypothetical protein
MFACISRNLSVASPARSAAFCSRATIFGLGFLLVAWTAPSADAALIAGWDFQGSATGTVGTAISMPPTTPRTYVANAGVFQQTSQLFLDGTNGSSSFLVGTINGDTEIGALNGITANTAGTTFKTGTGSPAGGSMALFERGTLNGKSMVFRFSMTGFQDLSFSFGTQRPTDGSGGPGGYGVNVFTLAYSTDGVSFLPWTTIETGGATPVTNTAFGSTTPLSGVNDAPDVWLRMTLSGATGFNSARLDNIQLNANPVPEPSTACVVMLGLACVVNRRARPAR